MLSDGSRDTEVMAAENEALLWVQIVWVVYKTVILIICQKYYSFFYYTSD